MGVRIGVNSKFKSRSLANSERRLPVAESDGPGEGPRAMAGIPEILILLGFPEERVANACKRAAHWIPWTIPKSTMWMLEAPSVASRMAWFAVKCANFEYGHASFKAL